MSHPSGLKRIEAILKPESLDDVKTALSEVGVRGMTVTEVKGMGRRAEKGASRDAENGESGEKTKAFRGPAHAAQFIAHVKLEVILADELVGDAVAAIGKAARTGAGGDGKIFVWPVDEVIRIGTGERGPAAL